jgi:hypothetical protein
VLALLARGATNRELGAELFMAEEPPPRPGLAKVVIAGNTSDA